MTHHSKQKPIKNSRRQFLKNASLSLATASSLAFLNQCSFPKPQKKISPKSKYYSWKMVTAWPKNFPILGTGANQLADAIFQMSNKRLKIKVFGAGELFSAFDVLDAVSLAKAEMGHSCSYYWQSKSEAFQFFTTIPFGLNPQEMNTWIYYGDGQKLWERLYSDFNIQPFLAGNTGPQMGGWFRKTIESLEQIKGLKIRIPGLGGQVLKKIGAKTKLLPAKKIISALQNGQIDAAEWIGPYNDLQIGFHQVAKYYYWPGWHEPGTALELIVNKQSYQNLPKDLQHIIQSAAKATNISILSDFNYRNHQALKTLVQDYGVQLKRFNDHLLTKFSQISKEIVHDISKNDPYSHEIYSSLNQFQAQSRNYQKISLKMNPNLSPI